MTLRGRAQRGVAIVSALLVAALITVLTVQWFAAQAAQAQAIETQRAAVQARWLVIAATDWALMLLREDTNQTDSLQEVWATPLARTRITDASGKLEAFVSGRIEDAQGRFNLADLVKGGAVDDTDALPALQRLMTAAKLDASKAEAIADAMLMVTPLPPPAPVQRDATAPQSDKDKSSPAAPPAPRIKNVMDLVGKNGLTDADLVGLEPYVVVVPRACGDKGKARMKVNINTASAPVIASVSEELARVAEAIVARRERISRFVQTTDIKQNFGTLQITDAELSKLISVQSEYFLATGRIELGRVDMTRQALIERQVGGTRPAGVVWAREL